MANIIESLNKLQRVATVVTRAAERCFQDADVSQVTCEYNTGDYRIEFSADILEYHYLDSEVSCSNVDKCLSVFVYNLLKSIEKIIIELESIENEYQDDLRKYGETHIESKALSLSSALMFKQIVSRIKV